MPKVCMSCNALIDGKPAYQARKYAVDDEVANELISSGIATLIDDSHSVIADYRTESAGE